MDPPLPIPNREVKHTNADGTAPPGGRVGRCRFSDARLIKFSRAFCRITPSVIPVFLISHLRVKIAIPHAFPSPSITSGKLRPAPHCSPRHISVFPMCNIRHEIGHTDTFTSLCVTSGKLNPLCTPEALLLYKLPYFTLFVHQRGFCCTDMSAGRFCYFRVPCQSTGRLNGSRYLSR